MKKSLLFVLAAVVLSSFFWGCVKNGDDGPAGAAGPAGESLIVMNFQDGVYPSSSYAGTSDNDLINPAPYTNYGIGINLTVGAVSGGSPYRPVFKFDISGIVPSNVTIEKAYMTVVINSVMNNTVNAYAITNSWNETESSWISRTASTAWTSPGGDYGALQDSQNCWDSATLTFTLDPGLVNSWITSPSANYGILLKAEDETVNLWKNVDSREYATASKRPKLTIYYKLP